MSTLTNKIFSLWQALLLILLTASVCVGVLFLIPLFQSDEEQYREAVKDAMTIEEEETAFELVTLTAYQNDNVKWNEAGDRCLLLLWHSTPELYVSDSDVTLSFGDVFAYSEREFFLRSSEAVSGSRDPIRRLRQMLGRSPDSDDTHFTAVWADPASVLRPAYNNDPTNPTVRAFFNDSMNDVAFLDWFNTNLMHSYFEESVPWTRLGYTYDYGRGKSEYGLTEFLIPNGTVVTVQFTCSNEEMAAKLELSDSIR